MAGALLLAAASPPLAAHGVGPWGQAIDWQFHALSPETQIYISYNNFASSGFAPLHVDGKSPSKGSATLKRASPPHLGFEGSDFSVNADRPVTICDVKIRRSHTTPVDQKALLVERIGKANGLYDDIVRRAAAEGAP